MRRPLMPLEQRLSALLLLALALAVLYWGLLEPWLVAPQRAVSEQMEELRQAQRRYAGLLGQRELWAEQVATAEGGDQGAAGLWQGADRNGAAAALMQYGADLINRHQRDGAGCELLNRTPLADEPGTEPYPQVQATFNLSCAIEPVEAILFDLESAQPAVFVRQLRIERNAQLDSPAKGRLEVQLTVAGYLMQPPATVPDADDSAYDQR